MAPVEDLKQELREVKEVVQRHDVASPGALNDDVCDELQAVVEAMKHHDTVRALVVDPSEFKDKSAEPIPSMVRQNLSAAATLREFGG